MGKPFYQTLLPAAALLATLVGCGGNGSGGSSAVSRGASMDYSLEWPERTRAMPLAANSAVVTVMHQGNVVDSFVFNRPASAALSTDHHLFAHLPAGAVTLIVSAYPEPQGGGVALAKGVVPVILKKGETMPQAATLASTATQLELTSVASEVLVDGLLPLTLTAKDAKGQVVLLKTGEGEALGEDKVVWSSSDETVATAVGGSVYGKLRGVGAGSATVTASFNGLKGNLPITVKGIPKTSVTFEIPWTVGERPYVEEYRYAKVGAYLDGALVGEEQTVERTVDGTPGKATLNGLIVGKSYDLRYRFYVSFNGQVGPAGGSQATIEVPADAAGHYDMSQAPFTPVPVAFKFASNFPIVNGEMTIHEVDRAFLKPVVIGSDGVPFPPSVVGVGSWKSSDENVATIVDGEIQGLNVGTATLTWGGNGFTRSITVRVVGG